jgi:hypothetical protein
MVEKREASRVPILTQIEAQGDIATALGHARNISLGGMLIETPETLRAGATVIVRFFIPPDRKPIEAAGTVIRVESGKSMAVAFLGLRHTDQEKILTYINTIQKASAEPIHEEQFEMTKPTERRSARVFRRLPVVLSWQDDEGRSQQEAGETQLLSRYGAMVLTFTEWQPAQLLRITVPDTGKQGVARVVWVKSAQLTGRVEVGLEVLGSESFWEMEFAAHRADRASRRRGTRRTQRVAIMLSWTDEFGRGRQEEAETLVLSKHGALLSTSVVLPLSHRLQVWAPELDRKAEAEVVWLRSGEAPGRTHLAIEFVDRDDFWDLPLSSGDEPKVN